MGLRVVFFISGCSALLFETLWFRWCGLSLGNSVWASTVVLGAFMAGLAFGNGLAGRYGASLKRPVLAYAVLEVAIAVAGAGLALLMPRLGPLLAPVFGQLGSPWAVQALRFVASFGLLVVPTTAMGVTLPLLTRALTRGGADFGAALGSLYGWNTLGAVAGALAGELFLIERFGMWGTSGLACALNVAAAMTALALSRPLEAEGRLAPAPAEDEGRPRLHWRDLCLLSAAFLGGFCLLALEVVWFRFLLLFVFGTSLAFAILLAVVLAGIAGGSLVASMWLGRDHHAHRWSGLVALAGGVTVTATYWLFGSRLTPDSARDMAVFPFDVALVAARLTLPTSLLSGVLFTFVGRALKDTAGEAARTVGLLTLANTFGAMLGSGAGGLLLLPLIGMEGSLFVMTLGYGIIALLIMAARPGTLRPAIRWAALTAWALVLALFPAGLMRDRYIPLIQHRFGGDALSLAAFREGMSETVLYFRRDLWKEPHFYLLVTNGTPMSGTPFGAKRYMKRYVYLPTALHPRIRRALVICYGVGSTAKAATDTASLESIDVVDISPEVLELGSVVFPPAENPLLDPRVRTHVEDGRFFLLTRSESYDLITGEPPAPKTAGVVSLYSREYFQLVHDRLSEGGITTYFLPTDKLEPRETRAITAAFCSVFRECSLWGGSGPTWMLMGTRGRLAPVTEEHFGAQWRDAKVAGELRALGFDTPELLGATFLADASQLASWVQGEAPVTDNWPHRLGAAPPAFGCRECVDLLDSAGARKRWEESAYVARLWPDRLRARTAESFSLESIIDGRFLPSFKSFPADVASLRTILSKPGGFEAWALFLLESDMDEARLARLAQEKGLVDRFLEYKLGVAAMSRREYDSADAHFRRLQELDPAAMEWSDHFRIVILCLSGRVAEARAVAEAHRALPGQPAAGATLLQACGGRSASLETRAN